MKNFNKNYIKKRPVILTLSVLLTTILCYGQEDIKYSTATEVNLQIVSAELHHFDKPIRIGPGKRAIEYREALVFKTRVNQKEFDALPPSVEPFLYIGSNEYRIYHIDRSGDDEMLTLTFHIRNWDQIKDRDPVVLTIEHGKPVGNIQLYRDRKMPLFYRRMIVDKRKAEQ